MIQNGIGSILGMGGGGKVAFGSYVGTGAAGVSDPCSVTCDFEIKIFFIIPDRPDLNRYETVCYEFKPWVQGETNPYVGNRPNGLQTAWTAAVTVTWNGNTISWHGFYPAIQGNVNGQIYRWIALG